MELPEHLIATNKHGTYCVPVSSKWRGAARLVLAGKVYERRTIAFMAKHCGDGDIVHAGAYFGDFIPALSKALRPGAHLWAFEPSSENYACARRTIELNNIANATLTHAALGAGPGLQLLRTAGVGGASKGGISRLVRKKKNGFLHEQVQTVAVDDIVPGTRKVTILQLDVEGSEQQALAGALKTLRRCKPMLVLEHIAKDPVWFEDNILALGYSQTGKVHENLVFTASK